ncbi:alpha/beta fold hydrolase [Gorillibacterium sp. sgz5001074]|uniref:alpha/beta fold hydrolase n=1 Tax=Gorillibacterium sp. sgz5001074 TaxID=3446695 RepID=UPI003F67ED49
MTQEGILQVNGWNLRYRIEGEGTPVLAIGSSVFYPRLFPRELLAQGRFIHVDHRGFAEPPVGMESLNEGTVEDRVIEDLEAVRQALGLGQVAVLGHSGHAFLAMAYARSYPEAVSKVILLNTAPTNSPERQQTSFEHFLRHGSPERLSRFERDMAHLEQDLAAEPERRFAHVCIRMGAQSFRDPGYDGAWLWNGIYTNMPVIDHLWGEAFARRSLLEELRLVHQPVFLGLGRYDYLVGPDTLWNGVEEAFPHVTKHIFEGSGHYPMLEEPEAFHTVLSGWLVNTPRA